MDVHYRLPTLSRSRSRAPSRGLGGYLHTNCNRSGGKSATASFPSLIIIFTFDLGSLMSFLFDVFPLSTYPDVRYATNFPIFPPARSDINPVPRRKFRGLIATA